MVGTVCFSRNGKFLLEAVFWGYSTILGWLDCRLFSLVIENSCSRQLEFLAWPTFLGPLDCRLFPKAWMVCTVNNFCPRKLAIWVCPLIFYQSYCFVRHAVHDCLFFSWWKILACSSFLRLSNYSWWWKILAGACWNFKLVKIFMDTWIADCFIRCIWYAL